MSREPPQRIDDIIACCEKIMRFTSGINQPASVDQELIMDAVLRNIEVIGEATKHLPEEVRARMPGIEWKKIAGMRDWISHVYYRVDDDVVRDVIETKIPELLRALLAFKNEGSHGVGTPEPELT